MDVYRRLNIENSANFGGKEKVFFRKQFISNKNFHFWDFEIFKIPYVINFKTA